MKVIYVTAFIRRLESESFRPISWYVAKFESMIHANVPFHVFLDDSMKEYAETLTARFPNVVFGGSVQSESIDELPFGTFELPRSRHETKDSAEYMLIQQRKLSLVQRAIDFYRQQGESSFDDDTFFAWIDFGLFHMFDDNEAKQEAMRQALENIRHLQLPNDRIIAPGCWSRQAAASIDLWNAICWRFCGSFLIGHHRLFDAAAKEQERLVRANLPKLTWEVNMWAMMDDFFYVFPSDHNARIILFLFQTFSYRRTSSAKDVA